MTCDLVLTRELGKGENFFRCRTEAGFYRSFFIFAAYSRDLTDRPLFYRALRKTLLDYHIFVCNLFKDRSARHILVRPIQQATLGDFLEVRPASKYANEEVMKQLLIMKFPLYEEKPLMKLVLFGARDLAVVFEHTLSDGVVAPYFHEEFLKNLVYCDDPANNTGYMEQYGPVPSSINMTTPIFVYADDVNYIKHSLPPPMEQIMADPALDYTDNNPNHYAHYIPEGYPEKWPGRYPASLDYSVAFKRVHIPPEQLKVILMKCKEQGCTLTAYISFIQALTLQPIYEDKYYFLTLIAVTLRRFLTPDSVDGAYSDIFDKNYKIMGNFAHMGVPERFAAPKEFSWDMVKLINAHLGQTVKNNKLMNSMYPFMMRADPVGSNSSVFTSTLGKNKSDGAKVSNLGFYNIPVYHVDGKGWTITDMVFAQDMAPNASEFVINVISTAQGGLNVVLSYFDHRMNDTDYDFEKLAGRFRALLLKYAGAED